MTAIKVSGLHKRYIDGEREIVVIRDLSFSLDEGSSLALTGPSGSGKSTLLNILAGTIACDAGEVWLSTGDTQVGLHELSESQRTGVRRRHIGYIHQFFNLVPTLTVLENVLLPAHLNKTVGGLDIALELLEQFGLAQRHRQFPATLSGGEQQRVAVARALMLNPPVLLADEPTGNLDANNAQKVSDMLFSAADARGIALIVATHNEGIAERARHRLRLDRVAESTN